MRHANFYPDLDPLGKGGNKNICKLYAYTATIDWFKTFFLPNQIHANKEAFTFDYNTGLLTNTLNNQSILMQDKLIMKSGFIADFEEKAKDTSQGVIYEQEISFLSDSDFAERLKNLNDTNNKQTLFVIVYNSGFARIVGHYNGGATLLDNFKSGKLKSGQVREIKYQSANFLRAYSCTIVPRKTKDWVEWWTYRHDFFLNVNDIFTKVNDGRFRKSNGSIINVPIEDIEYEETTKVVHGINYLYSIARFKLPWNTVIVGDHNIVGELFNNGEFSKFLDSTGKVVRIEGSGQFKAMYECVFGADIVEVVGYENFWGIAPVRTKSIQFKELRIDGLSNFEEIESLSASKLLLKTGSTENVHNITNLHFGEIVIENKADSNIKGIENFSANIITGKSFRDCFIGVSRNGIIREKFEVELAEESFYSFYDFSFPKSFILKDSNECIKFCEYISFGDLLMPGTVSSISSNTDIIFDGIIGPTIGNNNYCPNNIVGNTGTARFKTAYLNINNGTPEGDVAVIIDPANNSFLSIGFNL